MPGLTPFSIVSGGVTRTGQIHVPSQYVPGGAALPCIFGFHGKGGSGQDFAQYWALHQDKGKFAVFLDALPALLPPYDPVWRALDGAWPDPYQDEVFVLDVIAYMVATYGINAAKVYAAGFSSGGIMCQHLHLRQSGAFAGFAFIAASVPTRNGFSALPGPATPRPTISAVGEQDPNQWPGDIDTMGAIASRDHWLAWMGLDTGIDAGPTSVPAPGCTNTVWSRYQTPSGHGVFMWARLKRVTCDALHRVFSKSVGDDINASDEVIKFWESFAGLPAFP